MTRVALMAAAAGLLIGCGARSTSSSVATSAPAATKALPMQTGGPLPARTVLGASPDFEGIGPLRFGMTSEQMRKAWDSSLYGDPGPNDSESQACHYLRPRQNDYDLLFMIESDRFVRVDVRSANKTAPGGGRVGMDIKTLGRLYVGRMTATPNFYDRNATDLRIAPPHGRSALLLFETNGKGVVTSWRIGEANQVNYVEGCS